MLSNEHCTENRCIRQLDCIAHFIVSCQQGSVYVSFTPLNCLCPCNPNNLDMASSDLPEPVNIEQLKAEEEREAVSEAAMLLTAVFTWPSGATLA